jgi:hypothetical protein
MLRLILACVIAVVAACAPDSPPAAPLLALEWRTSGLANPESVALSEDGSFFFVTNVNGEADAKDGNGFVSRVSRDGRLLEREWAVGLDAPKGIACFDGALYVADIDQVVAIDEATGAVLERFAIAGAAFLNDVAIGSSGIILVSDSGGSRIYAIEGGRVTAWLEHELLESVNGLLPEADRLVVSTMQGRLLAIDYATREITVLAEGLGDADGLATLGGGRYLVSEWPGLLHLVTADGGHETLLDTRAEAVYMNDFLLIGDELFVPHWEPSALSAYQFTETR